MTEPAEPVLRLLAWKPGDPPTPGRVENLEWEFIEEILNSLPGHIQDQIIQASLDDLTRMGLAALGPGGRHWLTPAGEAVLAQSSGDNDQGGPVWSLTLSRPGPGRPWVAGEITEAGHPGPPGAGLACLAGAGGRAG